MESKNTLDQIDPISPRRDHYQGPKPKNGGKIKKKKAIRTKKKLSYKKGDIIFDDSISSQKEVEDPTNESDDSIKEVV